MKEDGIVVDNVGLVIEGGALRGIFTAGVLDYFMEQGLKFPYIVGVSAGACNLLGYAAQQIGYTKNCMIQTDTKDQYFGVNQLIQTKTLINLDRIFYEYPYNQLPFNFRAFFNSGIKTEFVVTNCNTGPLKRAIKQGFLKNVVILTRSRGNVPTMNSYLRVLYQTFYKEFPQLIETILNRPAMYKKQLALLDCLQEEGKVFVIRPSVPEIKRFETDSDKLEAYYQHGRQTAKSCWIELQAFLYNHVQSP
jgi:predicted patatin/cPLA2 family phospholipase